jgi:hypothetical protein
MRISDESVATRRTTESTTIERPGLSPADSQRHIQELDNELEAVRRYEDFTTVGKYGVITSASRH